MLVIRDAQLAVLGLSALEKYVTKTLHDIRELFPGDPRFQEDAPVRELIRDGIAASRRYDIEGDREVSFFIFLMCEFGRDFDAQQDKPWMRRLLSAGNLDAPAKMDLIYEKLRLLKGAAEGSDEPGPGLETGR
jgi:hypothetical protein